MQTIWLPGFAGSNHHCFYALFLIVLIIFHISLLGENGYKSIKRC